MPELDSPSPRHPEPASARNTRLGLVFFSLYLAIYVGYVALNAFWPDVLGDVLVGGVNLAILYGLVLIVSAFLMALLYLRLCVKPANDLHKPPAESRSPPSTEKRH